MNIKKKSKIGNKRRVFLYRQTNLALKQMQNENSSNSGNCATGSILTNGDDSCYSFQHSKIELLPEFLKNWALEYRITHRALNSLLKILISVGVPCQAKDSRSLLKTPRTLSIPETSGGKYWYAGIGKNIRLIFAHLNKDMNIKLDFNIDGLPLFKSSKISFWPILAGINGT